MKKIDPEKYYSASKCIGEKLLPQLWTSTMTLTNYLNTETGKKILKPIIKQGKKDKRYFIKGSTLIEINKLANEGKLTNL